MFSHWNYRIVKYRTGIEEDGEDVFEVCEVYYENGEPNSFNKNKIALYQDSIEDINTHMKKLLLLLKSLFCYGMVKN